MGVTPLFELFTSLLSLHMQHMHMHMSTLLAVNSDRENDQVFLVGLFLTFYLREAANDLVCIVR